MLKSNLVNIAVSRKYSNKKKKLIMVEKMYLKWDDQIDCIFLEVRLAYFFWHCSKPLWIEILLGQYLSDICQSANWETEMESSQTIHKNRMLIHNLHQPIQD